MCVDELEKTNPEDREVLPSLMDDQQVFNLSKFGVNKELPIRAASLHACNPVGQKYDIQKPLAMNLHFAGWLFDRYDLKFVLRNIPDEEKDKNIAEHFASMAAKSVEEKAVERKEKEPEQMADVHSTKFMRAWVSYVKKNYNPKPTEEALDFIKSYYRDLRKDNRVSDDITAREMGTLLRLARASARAHMRHVVINADVQFAIELLKASLQSYGIDPMTGEFSSRFTIASPPDVKKLAAQYSSKGINAASVLY